MRAEDRPAYTAGIGRALMLLGLGCALTGLINYLSGRWWGWLLFVLSFAVSGIRMLRTQSRYNR